MDAKESLGSNGSAAAHERYAKAITDHTAKAKFHTEKGAAKAKSAEPKTSVPDAENPDLALQMHDSKHLGEAARGERDLNEHAKQELASRGMDSDGKWIGFKQSEAHHGVQAVGGEVEGHGHFQTLHTKILSQAAKGEIDLNHKAKEELAARGQDSHGKWVGFNQAKEHHFPEPETKAPT